MAAFHDSKLRVLLPFYSSPGSVNVTCLSISWEVLKQPQAGGQPLRPKGKLELTEARGLAKVVHKWHSHALPSLTPSF
jgi:hypothetical protein